MPAGTRWFRIHDARRQALFFGSSGRNRFDAPAQEFGVLYVGRNVACAFIETFGHATGTDFVTENQLQRRGLSEIQANRTLRLVDLTGIGLVHIGADARLCVGEITVAQRFEAACLESLYNQTNPPDSFDSPALFWVAGSAVRLARAIGAPVENVLAVVTSVAFQVGDARAQMLSVSSMPPAMRLHHYLELTRKVCDTATRRVLLGETVANAENAAESGPRGCSYERRHRLGSRQRGFVSGVTPGLRQ